MPLLRRWTTEPDGELERRTADAVDAKLREAFDGIARGPGCPRSLAPRGEVLGEVQHLLKPPCDIDDEMLERLCPRACRCEQLSFEDFREVVHVVGAWCVVHDMDEQHIQRRWTALSDTESNYTLDFPSKKANADVDDDSDLTLPFKTRAQVFEDRKMRFLLEEEVVRREVFRRILGRPRRSTRARARLAGGGVDAGDADTELEAAAPLLPPPPTAEESSAAEAAVEAAAAASAVAALAPTNAPEPMLVRDLANSKRLGEERAMEREQAAGAAAGLAAAEEDEDKVVNFQDLSPMLKAWDIAKSLVAGGLAGAVAKTVIAPLDRTKIIFQTTERTFSLRAVGHELRNIVGKEGLHGLWRGHSATLGRVMPYAGIQFVSFDMYKQLLLRDQDTRLTPIRRLVAGSLAGATSVICTYPLDLLRARMSVQHAAHGGVRHNFRVVVKQDGLLGLYRGLTPTLVGILPYAGLAFGTFETLKIMVTQHHGTEAVTPGQRFYCGVLAGFIAQSLTYPLDIVRRRMQTDGAHAPLNTARPLRKYTSIVQTMRYVATREGIRGGLFKGLTMNWIKGPIAHGISFTTFDLLKHNFDVKPRATR